MQLSDLDIGILACFDVGLCSIGNASKKIVYSYLSQKHNLPRERVLGSPEEFLEALRELFGQSAGFLERIIVRELKQKFSISLGEGLVEVLALVRRTTSLPKAESLDTYQRSGLIDHNDSNFHLLNEHRSGTCKALSR